MRLTALSFAWLAGILLGGLWPPLFWGLGLIPALVMLFLSWRCRRLVLPALCLLLLLLGGLRLSLVPPAPHLVQYADGSERQLLGRVEAWGVWERGNWLALDVESVKEGEGWQRVMGSARLYLRPTANYGEGDRLWAMGRLEPGWGRSGAALFYPRARLVERAAGLPGMVGHLRARLSQALAATLPQPQAGLAQALVLGDRTGLPSGLRDDFNRSGAAHLLAISGLHIAVFAGIVLSFGAWALGRQRPYYLLLALVLLWGYVLLSGLRPPAVRAGIMASLFLWAYALGRPGSGLAALAFAAALMAGVDPQVLREVSFQLSFAAMAGLVLLVPSLLPQGRRKQFSWFHPVTESLAFSLAAWAATLPLVVYYFGRMPLGGMPATLLALPALPWAIVLGAITALVGVLVLPLAYFLAWIAWFPLFYMGSVAAATAAVLPASNLSLSLSVVIAYYAGLALLLSRRRVMKGLSRLQPWLRRAGEVFSRLPHRGMALPLLLAAGLVWAGTLSLPDDRLRVSFLKVGDGDAILLQRGLTQVLINGGPDPAALASALGSELPFWDRRLEGIVLTSPRSDHLAGLMEALRRYRVSLALEPELSNSTATFREWQRRLEATGIPRLAARPGLRLSLGEAILEVLNQDPVVLRLSYGRMSFLLAPDLDAEQERELRLGGTPLQSAVLAAGSQAALSPAFLAAVSPRIAVVSPAAGSSQEVRGRLRDQVGEGLYFTEEWRRITLVTDGERLWLSTAH